MKIITKNDSIKTLKNLEIGKELEIGYVDLKSGIYIDSLNFCKMYKKHQNKYIFNFKSNQIHCNQSEAIKLLYNLKKFYNTKGN